MKNKPFLLALGGFLFIGVILVAQFVNRTQTNTRSKASISSANPITTDSESVQEGDVIHFSLYDDGEALYQANTTGETATKEFISTNPQYTVSEKTDASQVKGSSSGPLLPQKFLDNSVLIRTVKDTQTNAAENKKANLDNDHYYYNQTINDIPVYGAVLAIHVKNDKDIYALDGSLVKSEQTGSSHLSDSQLEEIAKNAYTTTLGKPNLPLTIVDKKPYIFNHKLLGMSEDSTNYLTQAITVGNTSQYLPLPIQYFINQADGKILFTQQKFHDALNRNIYDYRQCNLATGQCPRTRGENQPATGDSDVDTMYTYLGDVYNYYKNNFGRDSFDGLGAPFQAFVHLSDSEDFPCPNAAWFSDNKLLVFCDGLVAQDVVAHEMTHAVNHTTADFIYESQSGALDEALADIFAQGVDPDWTMGEDTSLGVIRRMDDPTQSPEGAQPDRLFSPNYYCPASGTTCDPTTNDACGVHHNNGVINKMFYLMTQGGNFNGCSVSGIGTVKSHAIMYRALTVYFTPTTNYKDVYNMVLRACDDLYASDGNTCASVSAALQATELDQQPSFTQTGAACSNTARTTPTCALPPATATPKPTNTPIPTPTNTPTPSPTPTPVPTKTPLPTPTFTPGTTLLRLDLKLHGLGNSGDNKNASGGNQTPVNPQRTATVGVYTLDSDTKLFEKTGLVTYVSLTSSATASGHFVGTVDLGEDFTSGIYAVKVSLPQFLTRSRQIQLVGQAQNSLPELAMTSADVNGDNKIDILDYNILMGCYSDFQAAEACNVGDHELSDLTDDGKVNQEDYNLLVRELSVQYGQ